MSKLTPGNRVPWSPLDLKQGLQPDSTRTMHYFESLIRFLKNQFDEITQVVNYNADYPEGPKFKITLEGGFAIKVTNKSGAATIKGELFEVSAAADEAMTVATNPYIVQGVCYENGIVDGKGFWLVILGIADVLLEDGTGTQRGHWGRLSAITAGRADFSQDLPGVQVGADSVAYTTGSTVSGTVANTAVEDLTYLVMAEATGAPGLDATFTFTTTELLTDVLFSGWYADNHANSIIAQAWDYVAGGWDTSLTLFTLTKGLSADEKLTFSGLQDKHFDSVNSEQKLRLYHVDAGNINHRVNIDALVLGNTAGVEHFKEIGHSLQDVTAGTDQFCRMNIHLL